MAETAIWVALTVAAPGATRALWGRASARLASWEAELSCWAQAVYGVIPLYGPWVTGAVAGRDCGLTGNGPTRWLTGVALCAGLLLALAFALRHHRLRAWVQRWFLPTRSWKVLWDEPRWAFYRGAGAVFLGSPEAAQLVGLALGGLEWLARFGRPSHRHPVAVWSQLVRLGVSALLFALTRNLWLMLATQAAAAALIRRSWSDSATAG